MELKKKFYVESVCTDHEIYENFRVEYLFTLNWLTTSENDYVFFSFRCALKIGLTWLT